MIGERNMAETCSLCEKESAKDYSYWLVYWHNGAVVNELVPIFSCNKHKNKIKKAVAKAERNNIRLVGKKND